MLILWYTCNPSSLNVTYRNVLNVNEDHVWYILIRGFDNLSLLAKCNWETMRDVTFERGAIRPTLSDKMCDNCRAHTHVNGRGIITWFTQLNFNETRTPCILFAIYTINQMIVFVACLLFSENWNCIMILPIHYVNELLFEKLLSGIHVKPFRLPNTKCNATQSRLNFFFSIMKVLFRIFVHRFHSSRSS